MKVLFASAEVEPFAKVGGLGDVVGSLPRALRKQGVDARVLMPMYGFIDHATYAIEPLFTFQFTRRNGTADVAISTTEYEGVPIYFMSSWPFFGEARELYTDWKWDVTRFVFLGQAILATLSEMRTGANGAPLWVPEILHVNDWQTGLARFLLSEARHDPAWQHMGSIFTIHNMAYQGESAGGFLFDAGVPGRHHPTLLAHQKEDNLLGIGIAYSDVVTTVSPRYAIEIQYPRFGAGLETLVQTRNDQGDVVGILNGIDAQRWDPATDPWIANHYTSENFGEARASNKAAFQKEASLSVQPDVPLIGMVSRRVEQEGADLAIPALRRLLVDTECQFVILGSGDKVLEAQMARLCRNFSL